VIFGTVTGVQGAIRALNRAGDKVDAAVNRGMARTVLGGQSIARGNARGRPGPRSVTGDFNRTIVGDWARSGSNVLGQIGTNAAQGRRLELGFTGIDALGRYYDQPPYPYLSPSVPAITALAEVEIAKAIGAI
jgi:hypothetical protein